MGPVTLPLVRCARTQGPRWSSQTRTTGPDLAGMEAVGRFIRGGVALTKGEDGMANKQRIKCGRAWDHEEHAWYTDPDKHCPGVIDTPIDEQRNKDELVTDPETGRCVPVITQDGYDRGLVLRCEQHQTENPVLDGDVRQHEITLAGFSRLQDLHHAYFCGGSTR